MHELLDIRCTNVSKSEGWTCPYDCSRVGTANVHASLFVGSNGVVGRMALASQRHPDRERDRERASVCVCQREIERERARE